MGAQPETVTRKDTEMNMAETPSPETPPLRSAIVTSVQWDRVLEFTHLFRGFRLAINPAKITIALLAIAMIYAAGRFFDVCWGPQVYVGEIESFQNDRPEVFRDQRAQQVDSRNMSIYTLLLRANSNGTTPMAEGIKDLQDHPRAAYRAIKRDYLKGYSDELAEIRKHRQEMETLRSAFTQPAEAHSPAEDETEARARAAKRIQDRMTDLHKTIGAGIFASFLEYEVHQFDALVRNTLTLVRIEPIRPTSGLDADLDSSAVSVGLLSRAPERFWHSDTIVGCVGNMTITGPAWLFTGTAPIQYRPDDASGVAGRTKIYSYRGLYLLSLILLVGFSIVVLALAGGMICRLSALEVAGVERPLLKDVYLFARKHLNVFIKAPLAPFVIILALGAGTAALSLVGAIPFVGEILVGLLFIVFIGIAFVLMLLTLGVLGGFHLLFPTIAVEGSDTFDAMSRAFAYVYARPWRLGFYTLVSLFYGVITFLFVSFAVYVVLGLSHLFVGWGVSVFGYNHGWYSGLPKFETLWPSPHFGRLISPVNWYAMSTTEYIGAIFLHCWIYLLITGIGAYVISYYFSSHTMIYMLIRRSVDGQSLTEVCPDEVVPIVASPAKEPAPAPTAPPATESPIPPA